MMQMNKALGSDQKLVLPYAYLVETIHNCTLIIDDIEDKSEIRRGDACVHLKYGENVAINAGTFGYYETFYNIINNPDFEQFPDDTKFRIYEAYLAEMRKVHLGLAWDIIWEDDYKKLPTEENYYQMVESKTGGLFGMGMRLVAIINQLDKAGEDKIYRFAKHLGRGFQIKDDLLNICSKSYSEKKGNLEMTLLKEKLHLWFFIAVKMVKMGISSSKFLSRRLRIQRKSTVRSN